MVIGYHHFRKPPCSEQMCWKRGDLCRSQELWWHQWRRDPGATSQLWHSKPGFSSMKDVLFWGLFGWVSGGLLWGHPGSRKNSGEIGAVALVLRGSCWRPSLTMPLMNHQSDPWIGWSWKRTWMPNASNSMRECQRNHVNESMATDYAQVPFVGNGAFGAHL